MGREFISVEGIEDACKALDEVPAILAARGYTNGLAAAGDVMESALWQRTPVDLKAAVGKSHGGKGALVTRLTREIQIDARGRGGVVDVGFGPLGHIALWVEYGHNQVTGGRAGKGGKTVGFTAAHPFMRPAFAACADKAVDAFVEAVKETLAAQAPGYTESAA